MGAGTAVVAAAAALWHCAAADRLSVTGEITQLKVVAFTRPS